MKTRQFALLAAIMLPSLPAFPYTGACTGSDFDVSLSITTDDRGQITELLVKTPGASPVRYPEANATMVIQTSFNMTFTGRATSSHEALELFIAGKNGRMRLGNKLTAIECDWN
jgi:hypothetical protein